MTSDMTGRRARFQGCCNLQLTVNGCVGGLLGRQRIKYFMPILSGEATSSQTSLKIICVSEQDPNATPGHAFISYVREDGRRVDRLQGILEAAGIRVWRDTANLGPGQDWKMQIRQAITSSSLVFIACFSENSEMRQESYQYEELILAVEQMRSRRPGQPWLIPVRFAECQIPDFDLGAGRTLDSLQRVDLFSDSWETGAARLVAAVLRILRLPYIQNGGAAPSQKGFMTLFRRMRTGGEISFGDVRSWAFCLLLGCIAIITSFLALRTWPPRYNSADTPIPDPHRYLCYAVVAVASFISVIAILEGVLSSKWVNSRMRLEEARAAMNRRFWRFLRSARISASLAASILVLSGLVGFEDTAAVWCISLAAIGGLTLISLVSVMVRQGGDSLLASVLLLLASTFIPVQLDGTQPNLGLTTIPGIFVVLSAIALGVGWLYHFPSPLLVLFLLPAIPMVVLPAYNAGTAPLGPYVAMVACVSCLVSVAIGTNRPWPAVIHT